MIECACQIFEIYLTDQIEYLIESLMPEGDYLSVNLVLVI